MHERKQMQRQQDAHRQQDPPRALVPPQIEPEEEEEVDDSRHKDRKAQRTSAGKGGQKFTKRSPFVASQPGQRQDRDQHADRAERDPARQNPGRFRFYVKFHINVSLRGVGVSRLGVARGADPARFQVVVLL